jgi:hypothetical protein
MMLETPSSYQSPRNLMAINQRAISKSLSQQYIKSKIQLQKMKNVIAKTLCLVLFFLVVHQTQSLAWWPLSLHASSTWRTTDNVHGL